jgi:F5/8 type C domain-containing protein
MGLARWKAILLTLACLAPRGMAADAADGTVPLKTKIPEEILAGTPPEVLALLYPGLIMPPEKMDEFLVPEGTKNLALKKAVTSSESDPILGQLKFVTDGTKDGSEESIVELSPGKQWIQIDLGKQASIHAVYIWHYFREARSYHDVIVQVANDKDFKKDVRTVYNNDTDASLQQEIGRNRPYIETYRGMLMDAKGIQARHVRIYSNGNTANALNHYVEVEVFGKPI